MTLLTHTLGENRCCNSAPSGPPLKQEQCFGALSVIVEAGGCNITWYEGSSRCGADLVASLSDGRRNARKGMG